MIALETLHAFVYGKTTTVPVKSAKVTAKSVKEVGQGGKARVGGVELRKAKQVERQLFTSKFRVERVGGGEAHGSDGTYA